MATPTMTPIRPLTRQQGIQVPDAVSSPLWIDALALTASTASAYTIPSDAGGIRATVLRLSATTGPIYINFNGTATATASNVTDGTASIMLHADLAPVIVAVPAFGDTLSVICAATCKVTIEAWS